MRHSTNVVLSATSLIGDNVKNRNGDHLGEIEEIMLDTEYGRVAYAVLSFGGFLGLGDKLFAIPWDSLELNTEEKCFYLNVDKEQLENAPGFDKDNWPNFADNQWRTDIYSYYSAEPYWTDSPTPVR